MKKNEQKTLGIIYTGWFPRLYSALKAWFYLFTSKCLQQCPSDYPQFNMSKIKSSS